MVVQLPTTPPFNSVRSMIKKTKAEKRVQQQKFTHLTQIRVKTIEKDKKIKHKPIDGISFVTRLGKDSLRSSSPSLETPKVSDVLLHANKSAKCLSDFS